MLLLFSVRAGGMGSGVAGDSAILFVNEAQFLE